MKISYTLLILIAGTSLAGAGEVPKEGTYDYYSCWSGTTSTMQLPGGAMAATNEVTGMNHAKIPGTMFDNSSFRCIGFTVTKDKVATGRTVCESVDADGDKRYASFVQGEDVSMISFVSPIARLLMGKSFGDVIETSGQEIEVVAIS